MTNSMWVTLTFILPCSLITYHPMTNRMWVTLSFMSTMLSHHMLSNDQQFVSNTVIYFCHAASYIIPWPTVCEWHWHLFLPCNLIISHPMANSLLVTLTFISTMHCSLITSHPMTNRMWVMLRLISALNSHYISSHDPQDVSDIVIISSHLIPWPTACEWHWH